MSIQTGTNQEDAVHTHSFYIDENSAGGEALSLTSKFKKGDDPGTLILDQVLTLQSYGNSASLNLFGTLFTPKRLRKLANEIESADLKARQDFWGE